MSAPRIVGAAVVGILAAAALSGCQSKIARGPFGHDTTPGEICIPLDGHKVAVDGLEQVRNAGDTIAVIDKVALRRPKALRLIRVWAVPTTGELYGAWVGYPPPPYDVPGFVWADRQLANGARIPPSLDKYDRTNLVLVVSLAPGNSRGYSAGVDVWYHVGGNHYYDNLE